MQTHLIDHLEVRFGERVYKMQNYSTPGTPQFTTVRPTKEIEGINEARQSRYRSGVAMLLYLFKHSRLDTTNIVSDLS